MCLRCHNLLLEAGLGDREIWPQPQKDEALASLLKGVGLARRRGSSQTSEGGGFKPVRRKISAKTGIPSICLDPPPSRSDLYYK